MSDESRIMRLEEKVAFQDDLIEKLNEAMVELFDLATDQQKRIETLERRIERAENTKPQ